MVTSMLEQIETNIAQLSLDEQLWLMERLARHIRQRTLPTIMVQEGDLAAMAADPAIQNEIRQINAEFAKTYALVTDEYPSPAQSKARTQ